MKCSDYTHRYQSVECIHSENGNRCAKLHHAKCIMCTYDKRKDTDMRGVTGPQYRKHIKSLEDKIKAMRAYPEPAPGDIAVKAWARFMKSADQDIVAFGYKSTMAFSVPCMIHIKATDYAKIKRRV